MPSRGCSNNLNTKAKSMKVGIQFTFSFLYSLGAQTREWCHPPWVGFLTTISLTKIIARRQAKKSTC